MIIEYHRPGTLQEALELIGRHKPVTVPLGGGTVLSQMRSDDIAVVDLQNLGLNKIARREYAITIGATVTLKQVAEIENIYPELRIAIITEFNHNNSHKATIGGLIASGSKSSPTLTLMLACGVRVQLAQENRDYDLEEYFSMRRKTGRGKIITEITLPLNLAVKYDQVSKTPSDKPIVCIAITKMRSGRTRVAFGCSHEMPIVALDGSTSEFTSFMDKAAYDSIIRKLDITEYEKEMIQILIDRNLRKSDSNFFKRFL